MLNQHLVRKLLWLVPLLFITLACNLAAKLTSFSLPSTTDLTSLFPSDSTVKPGMACTRLLPEILKAGTTDGNEVNVSSIFGSDHEIHYLVVYEAHRTKLGKREDLLRSEVPDKSLDSRAAHQAVWDTFTSLIPPADRAFVTEFAVLTDGSDNILSGVSPTYSNPREWTLKVDIVDAENPYRLIYSLLHEYGHLLTLNASQVPLDTDVFYHPGDQAIYEQALKSCRQYFTGDGCSNSSSYMNEFFNKYWSSLFEEWQKKKDPQQSQLDVSFDFYWVHADQFLTSYAASNPQEDIAESWAFFILSPKPESTTIASQKILFFYDYPELITLRQEIRARLCSDSQE